MLDVIHAYGLGSSGCATHMSLQHAHQLQHTLQHAYRLQHGTRHTRHLAAQYTCLCNMLIDCNTHRNTCNVHIDCNMVHATRVIGQCNTHISATHMINCNTRCNMHIDCNTVHASGGVGQCNISLQHILSTATHTATLHIDCNTVHATRVIGQCNAHITATHIINCNTRCNMHIDCNTVHASV